jgi:hypothetical protein
MLTGVENNFWLFWLLNGDFYVNVVNFYKRVKLLQARVLLQKTQFIPSPGCAVLKQWVNKPYK